MRLDVPLPFSPGPHQGGSARAEMELCLSEASFLDGGSRACGSRLLNYQSQQFDLKWIFAHAEMNQAFALVEGGGWGWIPAHAG